MTQMMQAPTQCNGRPAPQTRPPLPDPIVLQHMIDHFYRIAPESIAAALKGNAPVHVFGGPETGGFGVAFFCPHEKDAVIATLEQGRKWRSSRRLSVDAGSGECRLLAEENVSLGGNASTPKAEALPAARPPLTETEALAAAQQIVDSIAAGLALRYPACGPAIRAEGYAASVAFMDGLSAVLAKDLLARFGGKA